MIFKMRSVFFRINLKMQKNHKPMFFAYEGKIKQTYWILLSPLHFAIPVHLSNSEKSWTLFLVPSFPIFNI